MSREKHLPFIGLLLSIIANYEQAAHTYTQPSWLKKRNQSLWELAAETLSPKENSHNMSLPCL